MPSRYTLSASHTGRKCSCNNILVCPRFRCLVAATSNMRAASPSLGSSDTHTPFHLLTDHCRPAVCPLPRPKCVDITACATSTPTACQTHRPAAAAVVAREAHGFTQALLPYHSSFINMIMLPLLPLSALFIVPAVPAVLSNTPVVQRCSALFCPANPRRAEHAQRTVRA